MGSERSKKIESQVKDFLLNKIQISPIFLHKCEDNFEIINILKEQGFYGTPDYIFSSDIKYQTVENMFFIEVNEITGGILDEDDVYKNLPKFDQIGTEKNPNRVLLNPPLSGVNNATMNKIRKTYEKYSIMRSNSMNLGIVLKVDEDINKDFVYDGIDLTSPSMFVYRLYIAKILSDSRIGRSKILASANVLLECTFTNAFKNLGFVLILGDGASNGYSLCLINRRILSKKHPIITSFKKYYSLKE